MLKDKKVLVTGGSGFIGSHLTEKLVKMGSQVRVLIRYDKGPEHGLIDLFPKEIKSKIELVTGDLKDLDSILEVVRGVDVIFHLGALVSIPYSYIRPREVIETNILGTLNVLLAAKEHNIEKIVHTSTSEVYGTAQYVPIDEKHPLQAQSPYSASKIGSDKIAESFFRSFNLPVAIIRPFNTYGPRQSDRAIIPTIITQTLTKKTVSLGSLTPTRDLTHVSDTVDGFIKIAESSKSVGEIINIGSGFEISIGDLAKKIISLVGKNVEINTVKDRIRPAKSEVNRLYADISKAKKLIGWEPKLSLEDGLKNTIDWVSKSLDFYKPEKYNI